ncbi:SusC/RagA family TonB-linked outer membrane protein [Prevotella cerevisiae]|uniref:SusC/RagA family TonB-linked outer membrane protein n=1 Tax=Segatella cerevisiae TaxID=2053716 RepID=A0ABT1BZL3_9BACT|nr:SusC/RagA family TonB-linked outer membrane protein [Segatella cerevisiae]
MRRDGSSRFASGHKWGNFPSFSAGWIISDEKFMESTHSWLDMLKIRASWGKLGNQNINSYYVGSDILSTGTNYSFGGTLASGVAVKSLTNKKTTWETTTQTDLGVDLNLHNGIYATVDYFYKKTDNILMQTPIPLTMGNLTAPYVNVGKVENKGVEATIGYDKTFSNGLRLRTSANLSHIVNKVTDLNGASPIINEPTAVVEGHAINSFYGYVQEGIYQISDFTWQNNSDPTIPYNQRQYILKDGVVKISNFTPQPGDIKYKDLNGDGIVDMDHDRKVIGKQFPDLSYAWSMNLEWKNFDFNMFWQGVEGIDGYTYYEIATCFSGFANMGKWWLNRWTPENPENTYPRLTTDGVRNNIHSTFYMENASYLRLKNIELGYTFDKKMLSFLGNCKVRVYGNVQNALTFTSYKGFDPEKETGETRAEAYPQTRIYTFGISLNF